MRNESRLLKNGTTRSVSVPIGRLYDTGVVYWLGNVYAQHLANCISPKCH